MEQKKTYKDLELEVKNLQQKLASKEINEDFLFYFENHKSIMFQIDTNTRKIVNANNAAVQFYGYSKEEFLQKTVYDLQTLTPAEVDAKMKEAIAAKSNYFEFKHKTANGTLKDVAVFSSPYKIKNVIYLISTIYDNTENKKLEEESILSAKRFQFSIETAEIGMWEVNLENRTTWRSLRHAEIFGYKDNSSKWSFEKLLEHVIAEDRERIKTIVDSLRDFPKNWEFECRIKRLDGNERWIFAKGMLEFDKSKKPIRMFGIVHDITDTKKAKEALESSEKRFKLLFDNTPLSYQSLDTNADILDVNSTWLKTLGYTREEVIGRNFREFMTPESAEWVNSRFPSFVAAGELHDFRFEMIKKDGTKFWVTYEGKIGYDELGHFKQTHCIFTDISERLKAELAVKQITNQMELILKSAGEGIFGLDLEGNVTFVNESATRLTGWTEKDLIDRNHHTIIHHTKKDGTPNKIEECLIHQTISEGIINHSSKDIFWRKDGSWFYVEYTSTPIIDENGNLIGVVVSFFDITDRVKAEGLQKVLYNISNAVIITENLEQLIKKIHLELETLIDTTNFYLALYDLETDTLSLPYFKDEFDNYKTLPARKTITRYVINKQESLLANYKTLQELAKNGEIELHGKGSKIWLGVPLKVDRKVIGAIVVQSYTDENAFNESDKKILEFIADQISIVIQRKKAEENLKLALEKAEESDRLKSAFLANMSHEIRTPMNGILGFTELLENPNLSDEKHSKYLTIIRKSGNRLLTTINDIIDISKIESNMVEIDLSDVNISDKMQELYLFFKQEVIKKGIFLNYHKHNLTDNFTINSDNSKLHAILTNLIKNAIKFTKEGKVDFGCMVKNQLLEFYVKDSGIGISNKRLPFVFDRFVQADIEDRGVYEGSGLGLTISKSYVEMLGGKIWAESEEGKGSCFYFTIPINNVIEKENNFKETDKVNIEMFTPKKDVVVLIAEDDYSSFLYLEELFSNFNYKIIHAENGKEAVEKFEENPTIDFILMDIKMPILNGFDATKEIRKLDKSVPIIAQTAYALSGDEEKALQAGCNDYVSKPIKKDHLISTINKYLIQK